MAVDRSDFVCRLFAISPEDAEGGRCVQTRFAKTSADEGHLQRCHWVNPREVCDDSCNHIGRKCRQVHVALAPNKIVSQHQKYIEMVCVGFDEADVHIVPDKYFNDPQFVSIGSRIAEAVYQGFRDMVDWDYPFEDFVHDLEGGRIRFAGVSGSNSVDDGRHRWASGTFALFTEQLSAFCAMMAVSTDGTPELGWIAPTVDPVRTQWIQRAMDPDAVATWSRAGTV